MPSLAFSLLAPQVYELLADESGAVRHAVAELVAAMLEEQGEAVMKVGGFVKVYSLFAD